MQLSCSLVDWSEIKERHVAGTLFDDLMNLEGDEEWLIEADDWYDGSAIYFAAGRLYVELANLLDADTRSVGDASLGTVLAGHGIDDLDANLDAYLLVLAPERVEKINKAFQQVDFKGLAKAYDRFQGDKESELIANFGEFQEYCEQWQRVFREAAAQKKGLLCHCG